MIKIALVDDHKLITDGITSLLAPIDDIEIAQVFHGAEDFVNQLEHPLPDLLLLDLDLPGMNGIECAETLLTKYPHFKIAILTMHDEKGLIEKLIQLGVKGYFLKTIEVNELEEAIRQINKGHSYFPSDVTSTLSKNPKLKVSAVQDSRIKELSRREIEIARLIATGMSNREIGEQLFISTRTVDTHRYNLMSKLDIHNVADLVRFIVKNNLLGD